MSSSKAFHQDMKFELVPFEDAPRSKHMRPFASASVALSDSISKASAAMPTHPPPAKIDLKPATDVIAGAMARAASQSTIHPLDTLKVRMQTGTGSKVISSKIGRLIPPQGASASHVVKTALPKIAGLYRGVVGAASGAGIAIGAYFAFYGAATNLLVKHTQLTAGSVAFVAGAIAAAGGSVVKVPLAVCIRSVQAGVYPNVMQAARSITGAAGPRGLFTGYLPTLLEDVPDMAFKFAAYESMRTLHQKLTNSRHATVQEDFAMGAVSGAFAAAATTPLDVIKTNMMCAAACRPTMSSAARAVWAQGGAKAFFRGVGPRALSNGINSAVFFCFFEALRASFKRRAALRAAQSAKASANVRVRQLVRTGGGSVCGGPIGGKAAELVPVGATLAVAFSPGGEQGV